MEERVVSVRADEPQSLGGCVVWFGWLAAGNLVLLTLVIFLMREGQWTLTGKDVVFWGVVAAVLALRYFDLTRLGGKLIDGTPAPPGHFKVYALRFVASWLAVWAIAHSVQFLS